MSTTLAWTCTVLIGALLVLTLLCYRRLGDLREVLVETRLDAETHADAVVTSVNAQSHDLYNVLDDISGTVSQVRDGLDHERSHR